MRYITHNGVFRSTFRTRSSSIPKGSAMETKTTFYQTLIYHLVFHGSRKCIGNRFVLMETKILIAHLLQKFTLKTTRKLSNQGYKWKIS